MVSSPSVSKSIAARGYEQDASRGQPLRTLSEPPPLLTVPTDNERQGSLQIPSSASDQRIADMEIPSALASLATMRQGLETLREKQLQDEQLQEQWLRCKPQKGNERVWEQSQEENPPQVLVEPESADPVQASEMEKPALEAVADGLAQQECVDCDEEDPLSRQSGHWREGKSLPEVVLGARRGDDCNWDGSNGITEQTAALGTAEFGYSVDQTEPHEQAPLSQQSGHWREGKSLPEVVLGARRGDDCNWDGSNGITEQTAALGTAEIGYSVDQTEPHEQERDHQVRALQAKLRHLEQQLVIASAAASVPAATAAAPPSPAAGPGAASERGARLPEVIASAAASVPSATAAPPPSPAAGERGARFPEAAPAGTGARLDLLRQYFTFEVDALKQELRAQQMEQSLSVVNEANNLRRDVSEAVRIERGLRTAEVNKLQSTIDALQSKLIVDFETTMDAMQLRLESYVQEAIRPEAICKELAGSVALAQLLERERSRTFALLRGALAAGGERPAPAEEAAAAEEAATAEEAAAAAVPLAAGPAAAGPEEAVAAEAAAAEDRAERLRVVPGRLLSPSRCCAAAALLEHLEQLSASLLETESAPLSPAQRGWEELPGPPQQQPPADSSGSTGAGDATDADRLLAVSTLLGSDVEVDKREEEEERAAGARRLGAVLPADLARSAHGLPTAHLAEELVEEAKLHSPIREFTNSAVNQRIPVEALPLPPPPQRRPRATLRTDSALRGAPEAAVT